jgi:hypothetical protein
MPSTDRRSTSATSPSGNTGNHARGYRQAADDALQQLDWAIGYLHGIGKVKVARALAQNRSVIRHRLLGGEEQPLPAQQTTET